ncbi:hypothetical protein Avbf_07695 [Armadillidium vulgare]|nr:hypothetical protein Avbf_07695 [Armadillidium vulgare]
MWNSFCGLVECRIVPSITQEKLTFLSPMISVALQSSHVSLRQRTRLMWTTSFASTRLKIPEILFDTLKEVGLPPASYNKDAVGDSQSLSPKSIKVGIPQLFQQTDRARLASESPKLDFKLKLSPLGLNSKSPMSAKKTKIQERNVFNIDEIKSDEFVVVSSPKVKKRVFTTHQIEKLNERSVIPALYNDLSQSQSQMTKDFIDYGSSFLEKSSKTSVKHSSSDVSFKGKLNSENPKDINKSYSEEELDEVLKNTSLELEKSFSDSVVSIDSLEYKESLRRSRRSKNSLIYTKDGFITKKNSSPSSAEMDFESNVNHKRKSYTPVKKSIFDIKKKLKGNPKTSSEVPTESSAEVRNKNLINSDIKSVSVSPLASPLKSPKKCDNICRDESKENLEQEENNSTSKTLLFKGKKMTNNNSNKNDDDDFDSLSDSHEEIPNSQAETPSFSILQPFKALNALELNGDQNLRSSDRPKRNKRRITFDEESLYLTASKRTKISPSKKSFEKLSDLEDSVICLNEEGSHTPEEFRF